MCFGSLSSPPCWERIISILLLTSSSIFNLLSTRNQTGSRLSNLKMKTKKPKLKLKNFHFDLEIALLLYFPIQASCSKKIVYVSSPQFFILPLFFNLPQSSTSLPHSYYQARQKSLYYRNLTNLLRSYAHLYEKPSSRDVCHSPLNFPLISSPFCLSLPSLLCRFSSSIWMSSEWIRAETWALFTPYSSFPPLATSNAPQPFMCHRLSNTNLQPSPLFWASDRTIQPPICALLWDAVSHKHLKLHVSKTELSMLPAPSPQSVPPPVFPISVNGPFSQAGAPARKLGVTLGFFLSLSAYTQPMTKSCRSYFQYKSRAHPSLLLPPLSGHHQLSPGLLKTAYLVSLLCTVFRMIF